jgi:hypothetical protein
MDSGTNELPVVERTAARLVVLDAAGCVLREETGIKLAAECIEAPRWRRQIEYVYRGTCWHQRELVTLVRLDAAAPDIDASLRVGNEREDVLGARWWSLSQIAASDGRFYPPSLATMLPRFLSGESLEEELERWPFKS